MFCNVNYYLYICITKRLVQDPLNEIGKVGIIRPYPIFKLLIKVKRYVNGKKKFGIVKYSKVKIL